jgi:hypothetical protein
LRCSRKKCSRMRHQSIGNVSFAAAHLLRAWSHSRVSAAQLHCLKVVSMICKWTTVSRAEPPYPTIKYLTATICMPPPPPSPPQQGSSSSFKCVPLLWCYKTYCRRMAWVWSGGTAGCWSPGALQEGPDQQESVAKPNPRWFRRGLQPPYVPIPFLNPRPVHWW